MNERLGVPLEQGVAMDSRHQSLDFDAGACTSDAAAPNVHTRCPVHILVGQIARTALQQHVLFLEGECLPRVETIHALEAQIARMKLVSGRVCVCSRALPLSEDELARLLMTLSDPLLGTAVGACARAHVCPLSE